MVFYKDKDSLISIIDKILTTGKKAIVFINNRGRALELHRKYKNKSMFNCSAYTKEYKYVDKDKLSRMFVNNKFDDQLLITTCCMDTGVNIIDKDVTNIICCDITDPVTLKQSIGRKRIQGLDDTFRLYIENINNNKLHGRIRKNEKMLKLADYLKKYGTNLYATMYGKEISTYGLIYDVPLKEQEGVQKVINELRYYKLRSEILEAKSMKMRGKFGFCKYILYDKLKLEQYTIWEDEQKHEGILEYLQRNIGRRYYKQDQSELINKLNIADDEGRMQKIPKCFNTHFEANRIPLYIDKQRDRLRVLEDGTENKLYNCRYWIIRGTTPSVICVQ